jgi:ABC-type transport system involved in multi-copper enzyme maturation permease subunit
VRERVRKAFLAVGISLLLLPLTLLTALIVVLSYPAYPIADPGVLQIVFDVAMVLQILAILSAWRLSAGYFRGGASGLARAHGAWLVLLAVGAAIGLAGAGFAVEHALDPRTAEDHVGFALLSPAVVLVPIGLLLWRYRRHAPPASRDSVRTDVRSAVRR